MKLSNCHLNGNLASEICGQLFGNEIIENLWLDLSNNDFSKATALAKCIPKGQNLFYFDISNTKLKSKCIYFFYLLNIQI